MKLTAKQREYCLKELHSMGMGAHYNIGSKSFSSERFCESGGMPDPIFMDRMVRRSGSHIYFYDEIDEETQLILEQYLREAIRDLLAEHAAEIFGGELSETVTIHLNSPGGYGHAGMALYDFIKTSQIPINCIIEGYCASAATLIFLACPNRMMSPNSTFLMHQCSWGAGGQDKLMQDLAQNSRRAMARLRAIYAKETKIGIEYEDPQVRDAYIQSLLEHDKELDIQDCIELGIIPEHDEDEELEEVELDGERLEKLHEAAKELAKEQLEFNKKKEAEEAKKKEKEEKKQAKEKKKTSKKETKESPSKKEKPAKKPSSKEEASSAKK